MWFILWIQAITGWDFLMKYLPVSNADDSCANNECTCDVDGQSYIVDQGRCSLNQASVAKGSGVSPGFGLHLVNCSTNTLGGGMTTAEVRTAI